MPLVIVRANGVPISETGSRALKSKDFFRYRILSEHSLCMDIPTEIN